jgi:hypothetical protein
VLFFCLWTLLPEMTWSLNRDIDRTTCLARRGNITRVFGRTDTFGLLPLGWGLLRLAETPSHALSYVLLVIRERVMFP